MKFGTKLKLKKDLLVGDYITIEKGDILQVAEYRHKYGMKLHIDGVTLIDFVFGWNDRDERINEYFEVLDEQTLSSEDIAFIKNLSNEINTQDNRCTAKPFTYRIQQSQKVISLDSSQYNNIGITIDDDYYDDIEDCFEYVEECVNEENESDDYYVQIKTKSELEDYLDELGKDYNYYSWQYEDRLCSSSQGGTNCFLTEKACEDFIKSNSHNLSNPKSYVVHEFRNNEMKQFIELVHKLAKVL